MIEELEERAPEGPSGRRAGRGAAATSPELTLAKMGGGGCLDGCGEEEEEGGLFHHGCKWM